MWRRKCGAASCELPPFLGSLAREGLQICGSWANPDRISYYVRECDGTRNPTCPPEYVPSHKFRCPWMSILRPLHTPLKSASLVGHSLPTDRSSGFSFQQRGSIMK